ncbi:hypothetical protein NEOLEDRAFT_1067474, partial [Neolentinus lepideus HHB14362 ss-1]
FRPERFQREDGMPDSNVQDPNVVVFGYGRQHTYSNICLGRHFSDHSLYLVVACILATFDITPPLDQDGKPQKLKPVMLSGLILHPTPFHCVIKPCSVAAADLICQSLDKSEC